MPPLLSSRPRPDQLRGMESVNFLSPQVGHEQPALTEQTSGTTPDVLYWDDEHGDVVFNQPWVGFECVDAVTKELEFPDTPLGWVQMRIMERGIKVFDDEAEICKSEYQTGTTPKIHVPWDSKIVQRYQAGHDSIAQEIGLDTETSVPRFEADHPAVVAKVAFESWRQGEIGHVEDFDVESVDYYDYLNGLRALRVDYVRFNSMKCHVVTETVCNFQQTVAYGIASLRLLKLPPVEHLVDQEDLEEVNDVPPAANSANVVIIDSQKVLFQGVVELSINESYNGRLDPEAKSNVYYLDDYRKINTQSTLESVMPVAGS